MTHVRHLGFELELQVMRIIQALSWVPEDYRRDVILHLKPAALARAVGDFYGIDL